MAIPRSMSRRDPDRATGNARSDAGTDVIQPLVAPLLATTAGVFLPAASPPEDQCTRAAMVGVGSADSDRSIALRDRRVRPRSRCTSRRTGVTVRQENLASLRDAVIVAAMTDASERTPSPMPIEELAMLECLLRIDGGVEVDRRRPAFGQRLVESCLAVTEGDTIKLSVAGIERCRALQHRFASDIEATKMAKVIVP